MRPIIHFLAILCLALFTAFADQAAYAQTTDEAAGAEAAEISLALDYDAWEETAESTENLISGGVASTSFFEARRADLVEWRSLFLEADTENDARLATIQAQIDALGPAPEEGETESETIALRRAALQERLADAQLPSLQANEAFTRADGLISEIDALLAERQAQELLELDPTPLNPVNWATAVSAVVSLAADVQGDLIENLQNADFRANLAEQALAIGVMLLIGIVLVVGGRPFVTRIGGTVS